jgi:hypothetical protein
MPRYTCICGHSISLSPLPNPNGYYLFSETTLFALTVKIGSLHEEGEPTKVFEKHLNDLVFLTTPKPLDVNECTECGRLALLAYPSDSRDTIWYRPECADAMPRAQLQDLLPNKEKPE